MFQTLTELLKPTKLNPKDVDQENDVFKCNIDLIYFFSLSLSNKYYISMLKLFCFIKNFFLRGHLIELGDNFCVLNIFCLVLWTCCPVLWTSVRLYELWVCKKIFKFICICNIWESLLEDMMIPNVVRNSPFYSFLSKVFCLCFRGAIRLWPNC